MPDPAQRFAEDLRALFVSARDLLTDEVYEQVALPALSALALLLPDGMEIEVPRQRVENEADPLDAPIKRRRRA